MASDAYLHPENDPVPFEMPALSGIPEPRTKAEAEHPWRGVVFQYRKVGAFRLIAPLRSGNGWWACVPVKAPKRYRDQAAVNGGWIPLCPDPRSVNP